MWSLCCNLHTVTPVFAAVWGRGEWSVNGSWSGLRIWKRGFVCHTQQCWNRALTDYGLETAWEAPSSHEMSLRLCSTDWIVIWSQKHTEHGRGISYCLRSPKRGTSDKIIRHIIHRSQVCVCVCVLEFCNSFKCGPSGFRMRIKRIYNACIIKLLTLNVIQLIHKIQACTQSWKTENNKFKWFQFSASEQW